MGRPLGKRRLHNVCSGFDKPQCNATPAALAILLIARLGSGHVARVLVLIRVLGIVNLLFDRTFSTLRLAASPRLARPCTGHWHSDV